MVIHDLHFGRARTSLRPLEADPPLVVDADAPLPFAPALECLQTVTGPCQIAPGLWPRQAGRACARRFGRTLKMTRCGDPRRMLRFSCPRNRRSQRFPFREQTHRQGSEAGLQINECHANVRGAVQATCGLRTLLRSAAVAAVWSLRRRCPYHDGSVGSPSPAARAMTGARNASKAIARHVALEVQPLDRLYANVYQPQLQTSGGIAASRWPPPR